MDGFILFGEGGGSTQVPNIFLDKYMPAANGEYVKIYLYLLRCLGSGSRSLSVGEIAGTFDRTEGDVDRALKYWEKVHLLKLEYDADKNLSGVRLTGLNRETCADEEPVPTQDLTSMGTERALPQTEGTDKIVPRAEGTESKASPDPKRSALSNEQLRQLIFVCEQYLGKPLNSVDTGRLVGIHDSLGFSDKLIEYLVEYCVSGGHRSMRYIEATAAGWHDSGINTVEDAKSKAGVTSRGYYRILKAFGITGRGPAASEIKYMDKWLKEDGWPIELVAEACSRTVAAISRPSFPYADKILSSWKSDGVTDLKTLSENDAARRVKAAAAKKADTASGSPRKGGAASDRFHNFDERDYDYSQLEQALVNK